MGRSISLLRLIGILIVAFFAATLLMGANCSLSGESDTDDVDDDDELELIYEESLLEGSAPVGFDGMAYVAPVLEDGSVGDYLDQALIGANGSFFLDVDGAAGNVRVSIVSSGIDPTMTADIDNIENYECVVTFD
ncbi:hypothetical protein ACFL54_06510 [Planctomycetota bacterium]